MHLGSFRDLCSWVCLAWIGCTGSAWGGAPLCAHPRSWPETRAEVSKRKAWSEQDLVILRMSLRTDQGSEDLAVTSKRDCGTAGCPYLVFGQAAQGGFCQIAEVNGFVEPRESAHAGRRDLVVLTHMSTESSDDLATFYRFDGKKYVESKK